MGHLKTIYSLYLSDFVQIFISLAAETVMCLITALPQTPLEMLRNIRYMHRITFLKSGKF
jgi:hypothetical protein